ncbi:unnamed protein product, partial [Porites evermanni]
MSQLICLCTCACAEWCYFYGQSLAFEGNMLKYNCYTARQMAATLSDFSNVPNIHFSELAKKYGTSEKTKVGNMVVNESVIRNDFIAPKSYHKLTMDSNGTLEKECFTGSDRKIPLVEIRMNLLNDHEKLGLVRDHSEAHYEAMTYEELEIRLEEIGVFKEKPNRWMTREELVSSLKHLKRS